MSVQITEYNNFFKINISGIVPYKEFSQALTQSELEGKFDYAIYNYDLLNSYIDFIKEKKIYGIHDNNAYYALSSNEGKIVITKRTFYDEKNPHTTQTKWDKEDDKDISKYDREFHIDDKIVLVNSIEKYFSVINKKHGLYHGSTFYNKWYNSKPYHFRPCEKYKNDLLILAKELIEEIKRIENIESIIDLTALDIIPKSYIKSLKK